MTYRSNEDQTMLRVMALVNSQPTTKIGLVTSYDSETHTAKVTYQPENVQSGWLPIATSFAGNNIGQWTPPLPNQQVTVEFHQAEQNAGIITGSVHSTLNPPGQGPSSIGGNNSAVAQGESLGVYQNGQVQRYCADGSIYEKSTIYNMDSNVTISGNVIIQGTLTVQKDVLFDMVLTVLQTIYADQGIGSGANVSDSIGSLNRLRQNYNTAQYPGVETGGASTQTTNKPDGIP
jgi:phage baseplate assembly protein gpV